MNSPDRSFEYGNFNQDSQNFESSTFSKKEKKDFKEINHLTQSCSNQDLSYNYYPIWSYDNSNIIENYVSLPTRNDRTKETQQYQTANLAITQEFLRVKRKPADSKNISKTFGNKTKLYLSSIRNCPKGAQQFMNLNKSGKQEQYTLENFRLLFRCKSSSEIFRYYCKTGLYLDLLHSNRISDPAGFIQSLEQYYAGSCKPDEFKSNRPMARQLCFGS